MLWVIGGGVGEELNTIHNKSVNIYIELNYKIPGVYIVERNNKLQLILRWRLATINKFSFQLPKTTTFIDK